jgi:hypothetical protein
MSSSPNSPSKNEKTHNLKIEKKNVIFKNFFKISKNENISLASEYSFNSSHSSHFLKEERKRRRSQHNR